MDIEQKYIAGLIIGSYKDFTSLYELYAPRLYAFVFSLTHSETQAKDIVQETFIKIWIGREQIRLDTSFKSYLFTVARNQLLNEFRKQINQTVCMDDVIFVDCENLSDNNVERELSLGEFNNQLSHAKQKLTPRQRELFELNKEQGIPIAELAKRSAISEQSVRNQLSQALHVLRNEMKKYYMLFAIFFV